MKNYSMIPILMLIPTLLFSAGLLEPDPVVMQGGQTSEELFTHSVQQFSDKLFFEGDLADGNAMLSPLSVLLALGMTANGAEGTTLSSMLDVLVAKRGTLEQFNNANAAYLDSIKSLDDVELSIANSLWLNKSVPFDREFLSRTKNTYHASAEALDFSAGSSLALINSWVNDATGGTITSILDAIDPDALMYLINAVYFKGDWSSPFTKEDTYEEDFHLNGNTIRVPFMHQSAGLPYVEAMDAQMLMMPYSNERFALITILPSGSADLNSWLALQRDRGGFTQRMFTAIERMQMTRMELSLPKFEASYKDSLADELKQLGMVDPFDRGKADFSRMTESGSKDLVIGEVLHKTFIRIDEKGSEAAAVTSVMIKVTSMPIRESLELSFDRPFFYAIIDREAGIPLFMGTMVDPASE